MFSRLSIVFSSLSPGKKIHYLLLVSGRVLTGGLDVVGMLLVGYVIYVATTPDVKNLNREIDKFVPDDLSMLTILLAFLFVFKGLLSFFIQWRLNSFLSKVETGEAVYVARQSVLSSLTQLRKKTTSEITFTVGDSTTAAVSETLVAISTIISEACLVLFIVLTLIVIDPLGTLLVACYLTFVVGIVQFSVSKKLRQAGKIYVSENQNASGDLIAITNSFREIFVYGKSEFFMEKFENSRSNVSKASATQRLMLSLPRFIIETSLILGVVVIIGIQAAQGSLIQSAPAIGIFLIGGVRLMSSLVPLQSALVNIKHQMEIAEPALEILKQKNKLFNENIQTPLRNENIVNFDIVNGHGISAQNVYFHYTNSSLNVVSDLNFSISPGEIVAFIGPSGAGKTTIVDLISGILEPSTGIVKIDNNEPRKSVQNGLAQISYVAQKPGLVPGTLKENIALGVHTNEVDNEKLIEVIEKSNLEELIQSLPDGLDTNIGKQLDSLSGGQLQRIGLARALYFSPKLLILDEATSALDAMAEKIISENILNLGRETTVIIIAHRLSTIQKADRVFLVEKGRITDSGTFKQLRQSNPTVSEYVKIMSFE